MPGSGFEELLNRGFHETDPKTGTIRLAELLHLFQNGPGDVDRANEFARQSQNGEI